MLLAAGQEAGVTTLYSEDMAAGMETATSMHLYFDADATAFRTTFRMDGESKILTPITPAKSANKLSPFVLLGAR